MQFNHILATRQRTPCVKSCSVATEIHNVHLKTVKNWLLQQGTPDNSKRMS